MFCSLGTLTCSNFLRFLQVCPQIGQSAPIFVLGLLVKHLAGVAKARNSNPSAFVILTLYPYDTPQLMRCLIWLLTCDCTFEFQHVEFSSGMSEQVGDVPDPFYISNVKCLTSITDCPIFALVAENAILNRAQIWAGDGHNCQARIIVARVRSHLNLLPPT